jgi:hypothetical protein
MAELKTQLTNASVTEFLERIADEQRRQDCFTVLNLMKEATRAEPKMWGSSIVGFGLYSYKYASGHEAQWPAIGFSPRKTDLTLYLMLGNEPSSDLMARLGKYKTGKGCLYIKKLQDVDLAVLKELVKKSYEMKADKHFDFSSREKK